jgi:hypothetical protein
MAWQRIPSKTNKCDIVLHNKKEKTCLLINIAITDDSNLNTKKKTEKLSKYKDLGDRGQQDVESEDKICASNNWSIRNNQEGIRSELSVAPRSPVNNKTTKDYTNKHCTHHS